MSLCVNQTKTHELDPGLEPNTRILIFHRPNVRGKAAHRVYKQEWYANVLCSFRINILIPSMAGLQRSINKQSTAAGAVKLAVFTRQSYKNNYWLQSAR